MKGMVIHEMSIFMPKLELFTELRHGKVKTD